jgi:hypothetical protein
MLCRPDGPKATQQTPHRRIHEDAILPNNQIVKDQRRRLPGDSCFCLGRNQERKRSDRRYWFAPSFRASRELGRLLGKRLSIELSQQGRQLGVRILELIQNCPAAAVLPLTLSDFPSSDFKYTGLEPADKGPRRFFRMPPFRSTKVPLNCRIGESFRKPKTSGLITFYGRSPSAVRQFPAKRKSAFSRNARLGSGSASPTRWHLTSGDEGARTLNPSLAKAVLSQLSYVPGGQRARARE